MKTLGETRQSDSASGRGPSATSRAFPVVAAAAVIGTVLAAGCAGPKAAQDDALQLSLPDAGGAMASCLPFTVEYLADMTPAFAATARDVTDDQVTLDVERWYAGDNASTVVLQVPPGASAALIGEIDFREGGRYLITASEGVVNMCGYSGEATPELAAAFEAAF